MSLFLSQEGKKIGIFGLGKTGMSCLNQLSKNADVICYDDSDKCLQKVCNKSQIKTLDSDEWKKLDKIISSAGVKQTHDIFKISKDFNIPILADIDILFEEAKTRDKNVKFIGVTGTNGKSTTTALIGHILQNNGFDYSVGGNIGTPALDLPLGKSGYVLELSSFMLDLAKIFTADIAVITNITPDHLDFHGNMESYIRAKEKIFKGPEQYKLLNYDDAILGTLRNKYANVIMYSAKGKNQEGLIINDQVIVDYSFYKEKLVRLQGTHNLQNLAAGYTVSKLLGIDDAQILKSLTTFNGLPHRMEYLGNIGKIKFYNDSKATNADSAKYALQIENIFWILGGIAKSEGISSLGIEDLKNICKAYLIGIDKKIFANSLEYHNIPFVFCDSLEEAFEKAYKDANAKENSNVLLSPAAASYDMFNDFEHRGEVFKKLYFDKVKSV
jgi:UDP-N-acetylmuramoylalanine--D-glutamate ligase